MKGENISKKILVKAPSFAFSTLLCKRTPCELEQPGTGNWADTCFPLGQQLNHRGQWSHWDSHRNKAMSLCYQSAAAVSLHWICGTGSAKEHGRKAHLRQGQDWQHSVLVDINTLLQLSESNCQQSWLLPLHLHEQPLLCAAPEQIAWSSCQ